MKKILLVLIAISFIGCKSKIRLVETSTDTIYESKIIKITPAQINSLVIDSPCDSLGNLKPFTYQFSNGKNKTKILGLNNTIVVEQNLDSIKSVWEKEYKAKTDTSNKVEILYKTPSWVWKTIAIFLFIILIETLIIVKKWTIL